MWEERECEGGECGVGECGVVKGAWGGGGGRAERVASRRVRLTGGVAASCGARLGGG